MINNRQGGRRRGRGGQGGGRNLGGQPGNRQDNRQRGNAAQLLEKYKSMARDAQLAGDRVQTEYYLQYADHYFRILSESRARFEDQRPQRDQDMDEDEGDEEFATDLAQAILVSHLVMIKAVLDHLGIPNEEGFFAKDIDGSKYFTDGWQQKIYEKFKDSYPKPVLLFYINHLDWEVAKADTVFQPAA